MAQGETRCPYYAEYRAAGDVRPYCRHKHSPVRLDKIAHVMGGTPPLACEGDLGKCQVSPEKRLDLS